MARKTWTEKFHTQHEPEIKKSPRKFADIPEGASMLIATPAIVETYLNQIPKGKETTLQQMRKDLAAEYHAEYTCPVTSGIFLRIVAEKAYEEYTQGKKRIAPFWRMISAQSPAAKKLTFGTEFLKQKRQEEGLD